MLDPRATVVIRANEFGALIRQVPGFDSPYDLLSLHDGRLRLLPESELARAPKAVPAQTPAPFTLLDAFDDAADGRVWTIRRADGSTGFVTVRERLA